MSLVQSYRMKLAAQQNRRLWGYLVLAIGIHGLGVAGLVWGNPQLWLNAVNAAKQPEITPIDFVYVDSQEQANIKPVETKRRAQVNTAAASSRPEAPIQAGKAAAPAVPQTTAPAIIAPDPSIARSVAPTTPPALPSPASLNQSSQPQQTPKPQSNAASPAAIAPSPLIEASPTAVSPSPQVSPAASPTLPLPNVPAASSALGGPIARSVAIGGEGLSNQANADRSGAGTSVDASRDDQWGAYLSALNRMVDQNWQRVAVESTRRTKIQFRVDRQGRLTDLQLLQSSGDTLADQAAMQAIRAAAPFAPLPQNTPEEVLIVNFTFTQWLRSDSP